MIDKEGMTRILEFISTRWYEMTKDTENKAMNVLPNNFWMNSVGGKAGKGRWVTALMYTENEGDAEAFREVLLRWQSKGMESTSAPDLIHIGKKK